MTATTRTLLCVGNFDRAEGYAWDTIRRVWGAVAVELEPLGVRTLSVYRQPASGSSNRDASPLVEISDGWSDWDDLAAVCRTHDVDACWLTDSSAIGRHYGRLRGAGVRFIAVHERTSGDRSVPRGFKRGLKRLLARRSSWTADRYIAISEFVRRRLLESACLAEDKVTRIYNAIDLDHWDAPAAGAGGRERLGLDTNTRLVVCTCRAESYKGVDTLIEAISRLPEKDAAGRVIHAVHCGDGPDLERFRGQVADAGLEARFHLRGQCSDVRPWIRNADVVVVPSRWQEAFGLAVVEGMAAGRPVVATTAGAIPELIADGDSGLLVAPGDPEALAGALRRVLDDPALAARLAKKGRAEAHANYAMPRLAAALAAVFTRGLGLDR